MTETPTFASLVDTPIRQAWAHEALNFTPWLAQNLERLSQAIGLPLELIGTEMPVEGFAADILAETTDGSRVLIENQLEGSDHAHLGQIMTYLAGLNARTVLWVAPSFREAHLSAVRWLNENTTAAFAFFAIRVRVVRIGDSPFAPLFEVLERPNGWDRQLQEAARTSTELTDLGAFRRAFWTHLIERHPAEASVGRAGGESSRWRNVEGTELVVVEYVALYAVGVAVRGRRGVAAEITRDALAPFEAQLTERLGAPMSGRTQGFFFEEQVRESSRDPANWDRLTDWLAAESARYVQVLTEVIGTR